VGKRHWGADKWRLLSRRLATLAAAPTMKAMTGFPGRFHALVGDRKGQFAISLWGPFRLIVAPNNSPIPRLDDGGIDVSRVTSVLILEVADYHDD
jgi:proteic killer suppression protein